MKTSLKSFLILVALLIFRSASAQQLIQSDVQRVIAQAAARAEKISPNSLIAVVDREGFVLGVWDVNGGAPTEKEIGEAISKAGTAAFLSSNENAFTTRTAGFIIQQNFPPGVRNKPPGPLVGVGFSQLAFSDVNRYKGPGSIPGGLSVRVPATSMNGSPGGVPLYKDGFLVGGVGVVGGGREGFLPGFDPDEDVALSGQLGFKPRQAILGSRVLIDGIRIPYVRNSTVPPALAIFGSIGNGVPPYTVIGSPPPFPWPVAVLGGVFGELRQLIINDPIPGTINGQARLTAAEVTDIIAKAAARSRITRAGIRPPGVTPARVWISVVNNPTQDGVGPTVLGTFRTPDATIFSWDLAVQKARTAVFFSNNERAFSTRTVGFLAQSNFPPGIVNTPPGPFNFVQELASFELAPGVGLNPNFPNGMTIFPGGFPLYRNGVMIGAIGVSGDGIDQDDIIAASGTVDFLPPPAIKADRMGYRGARLPYAKFPRNPVLQ
ncbi:MAG: heme-binding protein [Opitutaceae bacterium]|nr:heme-binding protein [Verrucomicrobiales bacterium]